MKLSLCIATFNEEKFIHYPLDSAYDLVDEVIIVDGGSEDKTVEIAKSYGSKVKVIHTDNPIIFHVNKQKAIEAAKGEWILQLDADEELTTELKKEIMLVVGVIDTRISKRNTKNDTSIQTATEKLVAYWLPRKNFFLTRFLEKGGQYPDYTLRLYKNGVAKFPCKTVHENVDIKGDVGYLKSPLLHYADPSFDRYLIRWNRYTTLDAELMMKKGEKPGWFSYWIWKPVSWFFTTYIRHRGYADGFPGFIFSLFSSLRFWAIYVKVWQKKSEK